MVREPGASWVRCSFPDTPFGTRSKQLFLFLIRAALPFGGSPEGRHATWREP